MSKMQTNAIAMKSVSPYRHLEKIVVNTSFGRLTAQSGFTDKILPELSREFALITGQKPDERPAKKSIAGFKTRAGQTIGLRVTIRGARLGQFLEKVFRVVLPRIRDFRGIDERAVDQGGNLNIGIRDQLVFPEVSAEQSKVTFGLQVTVVPKPSHALRVRAIDLYRSLGLPFKKHG